MTEAESAFHEVGAGFPDANLSSLFGKPCYKVNGKAFICFFQDCLVAKLEGADHARAIALPDAHLFDPSGKGHPMKAWVQLPFDHHIEWMAMGRAAHRSAF